MSYQNQNKPFQKDKLIQHSTQEKCPQYKTQSQINKNYFQTKLKSSKAIGNKQRQQNEQIQKQKQKLQQNYLTFHFERSQAYFINMINGIKPSEMDFRNRSMHIHYNKLAQISKAQNSCFSTFDKNFHTIVRRKKYNHIKWKHFKFNESQDKLWKQNDIVKNKIVKILSSKPKLNATSFQSTKDFSKSNYFYERKRLQTSIDQQNPQIAKRILKATGFINRKKDSQDFKKTRQIVRRLERFPMIKRLQHSIESSRSRFKTQEKFQKRDLSFSSKSISATMRLKTYV